MSKSTAQTILGAIIFFTGLTIIFLVSKVIVGIIALNSLTTLGGL